MIFQFLADCGSKLLATDKPQLLSSPEYPGTFDESNLLCTWFINVPAGYFVQLINNHLSEEACCVFLEVSFSDGICIGLTALTRM